MSPVFERVFTPSEIVTPLLFWMSVPLPFGVPLTLSRLRLASVVPVVFVRFSRVPLRLMTWLNSKATLLKFSIWLAVAFARTLSVLAVASLLPPLSVPSDVPEARACSPSPILTVLPVVCPAAASV